MRNIKSIHLVPAENLLKPKLKDFLGAPSIHSTIRSRINFTLKEAFGKIRKAQVSGKLKLALSAIYLMALLYFLTILLSS